MGASPIDRCTLCRLELKNCRICSADRALLHAQEEQEYFILKDHMRYNIGSGKLEAQYPFSKDPDVLVDNSKEALDCQISQEKRQIRKGTHAMYIKLFKGMVNHRVVSKVSQEEIKTYQGTINYITYHKVYKDTSILTSVRLVSNSSFKNGFTNLNDIMIKLPNTYLISLRI